MINNNQIIIKKIHYNEKNTITDLIIAYIKEKVYNT